MRQLAKFFYFKLLGWKMIGSFPDLDKCVVIVVPHTSWLDFFLGLLVRKIIQKEIHLLEKRVFSILPSVGILDGWGVLL